MSAAKKILIIIGILGLCLLIAGGIMYGVYHKSETHTDLKKTGLGLLIGGLVLALCLIPGIIMHSHPSTESDTATTSV